MNSLLASVNLNIASWELILSLFFIGAAVLLGLAIGRDRIFTLLLGSYISFALTSVFSFKKLFTSLFQKEENFVVLIVVFLALIGIIYFILSRSVLKSSSRGRPKAIFQTLFLSIFLIGIILSVVFSFFPKDLLAAFSPVTKNVFNTMTARLLWLVLPLIFIGIFKGNNSRTKR